MDFKDAREFGRLAFERGARCVPCLDVPFVRALEANPGNVLEALNGWHRGWALANVSEPVPGWEDADEAQPRIGSEGP